MTEPSNAADDEEGTSEAAPAKKPRFGKRLIIIGAALAVLLIGGGAAALFLLGSSGSHADAAETADAEASAESEGEGAEAFIDVPPLILNLRSADGAARFLKLRFMLVAANPAASELIQARLPLLIDAYQPFLRELRPEDLAGSAAVYRIKEEMLVRATATYGPGKVKDVLIQDLIQQ